MRRRTPTARHTCAAARCPQLRKLLDAEAAISLEARAALEEAQAALCAAKAEAAGQLAKLRRDLERRDEAVRGLERALEAPPRTGGDSVERARTPAHAAAAAAGAAPPGTAGGVRVSRVGLAASAAPEEQSLADALEVRGGSGTAAPRAPAALPPLSLASADACAPPLARPPLLSLWLAGAGAARKRR